MRLADWQSIVSQLQSSLHQWTTLPSGVPEGTALVALLLPVVLAIFSKRLIVVLGCLLLSVMAFCIFVAPSNITTMLAAGIYLGSVFVALSGIVARRKARTFQNELANLRSDLDQVLHADERRLLRELQSSSVERNTSVSTTPASDDSSA